MSDVAPDPVTQADDSGPAVESEAVEIPPMSGGPIKRLPTTRIAFQRQLDLLRAYAAKSQGGKRPASNEDVSEIVGLTKDTISLGNAFFAETGFLVKNDGGYTPCVEVLNFARVYQWKQDEAAVELAPRLRSTWFAGALLDRLSYAPMSEDDAVAELAKTAEAGPAYRPQLETLLEYLEAARMIKREGGQVTLSQAPQTAARRDPEPPATPAKAQDGQLPLLIQGLLRELPTESWTRDQMEQWIALARNVFEVVYKIPSQEKPKDSP